MDPGKQAVGNQKSSSQPPELLAPVEPLSPADVLSVDPLPLSPVVVPESPEAGGFSAPVAEVVSVGWLTAVSPLVEPYSMVRGLSDPWFAGCPAEGAST